MEGGERKVGGRGERWEGERRGWRERIGRGDGRWELGWEKDEVIGG